MGVDNKMFLANAQTLVHAVGAWDCTDPFNTRVVQSDLGKGRSLACKAVIRETYLATGGASTLALKLQEAPDNGSGAPGSWVDLPINTGDIAKATLVAGYVMLDVLLPKSTKQWLKGVLEIKTNDGTAGKIDVWFDIR